MKQILRTTILAFSSALAVAACSSDSNPTVEPNNATIALTSSTSAVTIARNSSNTIGLTLTRGGNYTGTVSLAAEGLPTGVTATFTPASLSSGTNTSVLALSVGAAATPGTTNFNVRASGEGVTSKLVPINITIPAASITLQLGGATATLTQGASTTIPVTITRVAGYDQPVTLTADGLPTGVTATFAPATIAAGSTTSTLTLTATAGATVGNSNVVVRANGEGITQQSASIALTVNAATQADFSLTAAPAALSVIAGGSSESTITIGRIGGFQGAVNLTVEGAPAGVTATVNPSTAPQNTSTLSVATTAAVAPGTYNLTIRGAATGTTGTRTTTVALTVAAAPGVSIVMTPSALPITQAQSGQTVLIVQRNGGLAGNIDMSVENLPAGVTAQFQPNPVTGVTTTLTLNVALATTPGVYNLTVRGTGAGGATGTATLQLTVTAASAGTIAINTVPQNLTVQAGQQQIATVNIGRGGGFTGVVNLSASGVPNGVNAIFTPQAAAGAQSTLGFEASVGATPGTYPITITGSATGLQNASTILNLTITPAGGGANSVLWQFCDDDRVPTWFAYKDGANGAWTRVLGNANHVFTFNINSDVGGVAYVMAGGGAASTEVFYLTRTELQAQATSECASSPPAGKTVNGTVQGLGADFASVAFGGAATILPITAANPNFQLTNVQQGAHDLLALRSSQNFTPNRMVLFRNQNIANGGSLPAIDFADAATSFAPATGTITFVNATGELLSRQHLWLSAAGALAPYLVDFSLLQGNTASFYGIPTARLVAGELHGLAAITGDDDGSESRSVFTFFRTVADKTVTFGAPLNPPTYSTSTAGGVLLPRALGTIQTEYDDWFIASFEQATGNKDVTITASRGYFGTSPVNYDLQMPNLVPINGFNAAWGLTPGAPLDATMMAVGFVTGTFNVFADGATWRTAALQTTINP